MVAILENPEIRQMVGKISVRDYEAFGERVGRTRTELIRGLITEKVTASPFHSSLLARLQEMAQAAAKLNAHCRQEQPLKLKDSMPEPDLAVVAGQLSDYWQAHPTTALLVIEIAVSSLELDRGRAAIYAEAGVTEYWLVVASKETIEVYTEPRNEAYQQQRNYERTETLAAAALPALRVDLDALFAR